MKRLRKFKKGEIVTFTEGIYSNFALLAVGEALQDFDGEAVLLEFLEARGVKPEKHHSISSMRSFEFLKHLIVDKELIKEINTINFHLGDYGRVDEVATTKETSFIDETYPFLKKIRGGV